MASEDRFRTLERTRGIIQDMGWEGLGKSLIGTVAVSVVLGGLDIINALFQIPIQLFQSFAQILPAVNVAFLQAPLDFLEAGVQAGAAAFGVGWTGLLGPFQGPFGVALALFMVWEVLYFLDYVDSDVIGVVLDAPDFILGSDDTDVAGAEDDD